MPTRLISTSASCGGRGDRLGIAQVGLHGMDLPDPPHRLQKSGQFRPPHRDADAVAAPGQRAHHVPAQKAGAAIDGDEGIEGTCDHATLDVPGRPPDAADGCRITGSVSPCTGPAARP